MLHQNYPFQTETILCGFLILAPGVTPLPVIVFAFLSPLMRREAAVAKYLKKTLEQLQRKGPGPSRAGVGARLGPLAAHPLLLPSVLFILISCHITLFLSLSQHLFPLKAKVKPLTNTALEGGLKTLLTSQCRGTRGAGEMALSEHPRSIPYAHVVVHKHL